MLGRLLNVTIPCEPSIIGGAKREKTTQTFIESILSILEIKPRVHVHQAKAIPMNYIPRSVFTIVLRHGLTQLFELTLKSV